MLLRSDYLTNRLQRITRNLEYIKMEKGFKQQVKSLNAEKQQIENLLKQIAK